MTGDDAPTLTQRQLQIAVLARQHLLLRAPPLTPIADVVHEVAGLQTQYAPSAYIGLWSRLAGFERNDLTDALERRHVVQATLMRGTIHVVAAADYWPMRIATLGVLRGWFLRFKDSPSERSMRDAADRVRAAFDRHERLTRKELDEHAGDARLNVGLWQGLVRVPPSGTWERRRADLFADAESWVGPQPEMTVNEARQHLVRRYLTGFGPASVKEIATFASAKAADFKDAAEAVVERRFLAEDGTELLDLDGLPRPDRDSDVPVCFLGNWEAILLVHARRALIIREEDRVRIFNAKMPQSLPTVLVDGRVVGTWRYADGRIEIDYWYEPTAALRRKVDAEAEPLARFYR